MESFKEKARNLKNRFLKSKFLTFTLGLIIGVSYTYITLTAPALFKPCITTIEIHPTEAESTPEPPEPTPIVHKGIFTAYTASVEETDSDPFTMANGHQVHPGAIANNCLKFGTKIKVNNKVYIVEDRMNSRYDCQHFDIYMLNRPDALQFGRRTLDYSIIK